MKKFALIEGLKFFSREQQKEIRGGRMQVTCKIAYSYYSGGVTFFSNVSCEGSLSDCNISEDTNCRNAVQQNELYTCGADCSYVPLEA